jgi:hypothetical protein
MLAAFTPDVLTPFTFEHAAEAARAALYAELNAEPSREALGLMLAKTALETGRWKKIHCFNWGNIKASQKWSGMYTCILLNEVLNGKVVWFAPEGQLVAGPGTGLVGTRYPMPPAPEPETGYGHPQTRMRAYANKFDGAYDYVGFISQGRYAGAFKTMLSGDPIQWVHSLKQLGYFTADEATYAKGVASLHREMVAKLSGDHFVTESYVDDQAYEIALASARLALHRELELLDNVMRDERDRNLRGSDDDDLGGGNSNQGSNS